MSERLAFEEFHHDVWLTLVLANVVNRADVGVIQSGGRAGLAAEPFQCLLVLKGLLGQKLERHAAAKSGVFTSVDHSHAATSELVENAVVSDSLAGHVLTQR